MKRHRPLALPLHLLIFLLILLSPSLAANYQGDWNGSSQWSAGWSNWSYTSTGFDNEVSMTVYLPVSSWNSETSDKNYGNASSIQIAVGSDCSNGNGGTCTVRKYLRSNTYCARYNPPYKYCTNFNNRLSSCDGKCECGLGSVETGWCIYKGYYCAGNPTAVLCSKDPKAPIHCRFFDGGTEESGGGDCAENTTDYWYQTATSFDYNSWRKSLSEADGYARKIYVYSYPLKVYVNYNGNGANGRCTSWASGSNNVNSNTGIAYSLGNPVCNSGNTTTGSMASGENVYIPWSNDGADLSTNQYYRNGYDFIGWSRNPNATVAEFTDGHHLNSATLTNLGKKPGSTLTLYAVWKKHTYTVTYQYYCGEKSPDTYQYGTGLSSLGDLNVEACNDTNKSGEDGKNANTVFVGWFTDSGLTNRITAIPSSWWTDVTIYGQVKQSRYFNYSQGKWDWNK